MENEKDNLYSKRTTLYNEISRLNDRIREIDLDDGLNILSKYIGKYYKENDMDIVYYISELTQTNNHPRLKSLSVTYYVNEIYVKINIDELDKDQLDDLVEITKDEFMLMYNNANEILTKKLPHI